MGNKTRLGIADDDEVSRKIIIHSLESEHDLEVVLEAEDGLHLLEQLKTVTPDVILMDIRMPDMDGIRATEEIMLKYPRTKIIGLSSYSFENSIAEMYEKGAKGFLVKGCEGPELIRAIREVSKDRNYVTNKSLAVLRQYIKKAFSLQREVNPTDKQKDLSKLSSTELMILWHTACFKSIKQIAEDVNISPSTVNNHQYAIRKKLNLKGRQTLLQYGVSVKEILKEMIEDTPNLK